MSGTKSIKYNFALNLTNTLVGLLFPVVTFPYISRILMADGVGLVQFFQSIINYVTLFSALGIPLYAVREIAKIRENLKERNRVTVEILILHTFLSLLGYIIVFALAFTVERIHQDLPLFLLLSSHILLTAIGVTWFYQAIEDFKYITIRSLTVKLCSIVALFSLVRTKDDLFVYAAILVFAEVGNNLFNFIRLRKFLRLRDFTSGNLKIFRHLKPALKIFILNLIISVYINLDSLMLGFLSSDAAVGYYAAATRLTKALLGIVTALGTVLLPRLSGFLSNREYERFRLMAKKASYFVVTVSIPMTIGLIVIAPQVIPVFCGEGFIPSIITLRIVSPILLFIGLSGLTGMQILYSQHKENIVIISTLSGALLNVSLNFVLIPVYAQNGAAIATVIAEFTVTAVMILLGKKYIPFTLFNKENFKILFFSILMIIPLFFIQLIPISVSRILILEVIIASLIYTVLLIIDRNEFALQFINLIKQRLK